MPIHYADGNNMAEINFGATKFSKVYKADKIYWQKGLNPNAFVMEFTMGAGETLTIPLFNTTGYSFRINWKDGNISPLITTYNDANLSHTYSSAGTYQIELTGTVIGIYFNGGGSKLKLTKIVQWGNVGMTSTIRSFSGCSNLSGTLPEFPSSVTSIEDYAFLNCSGLTGVSIPSSVTSIGYQSFFNCSGLTGTLTIPSSITAIGDSAFGNCTGLTGTLTIPSSITAIGLSVFSNCSGLTGVSIPSSVTSIGSSAFRNCTGLTGTLTIPSSVTSIGDQSFRYCSNASLVIWMENTTPPTLGGSYVFDNTASTLQIKVPSASVTTYRAATYWSEYAAKIISQ